MRNRLLGTAVLTLSFASVSAHQDVDSLARSLVPLLKDVRRSIEPKLSVEPGQLPPSPFTGRNSTLFAFRMSVRSIDVEPRVVEAIDRLLGWNQRSPLAEADRALIERWREALRVKMLGRLAATGGKDIGCDDACLLEHLTKPSRLFGSTGREQNESRNQVLLDALAEAVDDQPRA